MATNGNIASLKSQENLRYFTMLWKTKKNDNKTFRKPKGKLVILNLWSIKFSKCHVGALLLYLTDMRKFIRYCSGGNNTSKEADCGLRWRRCNLLFYLHASTSFAKSSGKLWNFPNWQLKLLSMTVQILLIPCNVLIIIFNSWCSVGRQYLLSLSL